MRRRGRELLSLSFSLFSPTKRCPLMKSPLRSCDFQTVSTFSTSSPSPSSSSSITPSVEEERKLSKTQRDSLILEEFRQRKLKGSSTSSTGSTQQLSNSATSCSASGNVTEKGLQNEGEPTRVVTNFKELGISKELIEVLEGIGAFVPSEIQCVVIPAILEGKSVLLSSPPEPDRTLAYLLPLFQLLRRDGEFIGSNSKHVRAIVLCATEEKAEQCFNAAKYIIHNSELKSGKDCASLVKEQSNVSIGLTIGTPGEILQYIKEGTVIPAEIRYLVIDEADCMFDGGLGPEIHKILRPLEDHESKSVVKRLQTVLVISTITEVLGEQSPIVKHLERDHAGNISAMSLEMEQTEVFHFTESLDALRKKVAEAMDTFLKGQ